MARNSVTDISPWTDGTGMTMIRLLQIWPYKTALEVPSEGPLGWHYIMVGELGGKYSQQGLSAFNFCQSLR